MSEIDNSVKNLDPDPMQIASVGIAASSFVLSLVNMYLTHGRKISKPLDHNEGTILDHLDDSSQKALSSIKTLTKHIERASSDIDAQFYDAPLRISETALLMSQPALQTYGQQLGTTYANIGNLGVWINHLISSNPDLASRIGERLSIPLSDVANQINDAMSKGSPIRIVIRECRLSLEQLAIAIEAELNDGRN